MKLELKIQLLKFCSAVFNSIFLVLGLSIAGSAVWILFDTGSFLTVLSSVELQTVAVGLLAIGGVVIVVSVAGFVGAEGEHRFLLLIYESFLIVLVLGQMFVTLLLLINREKIEQSLDKAVEDIIHEYGGHNSEDTLFDNVQHYGKCCGRKGPADWLQNRYIHSLNLTSPVVLPCSCFSSYRRSLNSPWCADQLNFTQLPHGRGNGSYEQGCKETLTVWLQENAVTILSIDVGLMLIQVLQFVVMIYLYRAFGKRDSLKASNQLADDPDPDALDYGEHNYIDYDGDDVDPNDPLHYNDSANLVQPPHLLEPHDNMVYQEPAQEYQQASW